MKHVCPRTLGEHGCADCLRNRTYRKRVWVHRMMLESRCHAENSFLTLTYNDENLPEADSLQPRDVMLWLKRFRGAVSPFKVRYFIVGEYGDESGRPHYHAALFGIGPEYEDVVRETWKMGHVMLAELNIKTMRYIAGYVTKKMTSVNDDRLNGRHPEFTRMSLKPGIGACFIPSIVDALDCEAGAELLKDDVPQALVVSGRPMPLGQYMRGKIRDEAIYQRDKKRWLADQLGVGEVYEAVMECQKHDEKMRSLYSDYENSSMASKMNFLEYLKQKRKQVNLNIEAQFNLTKKGLL